jgi:hypothetical protein
MWRRITCFVHPCVIEPWSFYQQAKWSRNVKEVLQKWPGLFILLNNRLFLHPLPLFCPVLLLGRFVFLHFLPTFVFLPFLSLSLCLLPDLNFLILRSPFLRPLLLLLLLLLPLLPLLFLLQSLLCETAQTITTSNRRPHRTGMKSTRERNRAPLLLFVLFRFPLRLCMTATLSMNITKRLQKAERKRIRERTRPPLLFFPLIPSLFSLLFPLLLVLLVLLLLFLLFPPCTYALRTKNKRMQVTERKQLLNLLLFSHLLTL